MEKIQFKLLRKENVLFRPWINWWVFLSIGCQLAVILGDIIPFKTIKIKYDIRTKLS